MEALGLGLPVTCLDEDYIIISLWSKAAHRQNISAQFPVVIEYSEADPGMVGGGGGGGGGKRRNPVSEILDPSLVFIFEFFYVSSIILHVSINNIN